MKKQLLSKHFWGLCILVLSSNLWAQNSTASYQNLSTTPHTEKCGFDDIHTPLLNSDPIYKQNFQDLSRRARQWQQNPASQGGGSRTTLTVPVVVHVHAPRRRSWCRLTLSRNR